MFVLLGIVKGWYICVLLGVLSRDGIFVCYQVYCQGGSSALVFNREASSDWRQA